MKTKQPKQRTLEETLTDLEESLNTEFRALISCYKGKRSILKVKVKK